MVVGACGLGTLMVPIFFDRIRIRFGMFVFDFEYLISVTDSYSNAQKLYFYDVDIHYNFIQQKLTLFVFNSVFEHKYKNKYNINNIRPYPLRLEGTVWCAARRIATVA